MAENKIADLEILLKDLRVGVKVKFEYKMVSPVNIIKAKQGPLNLEAKLPVGMRTSRLARKLQNQRTMEEYLTEVGIDGWELVTDLVYEGLPYNGALVFKKRYYVDEEKAEESTVIANFKENLNKGNLYQEFEQDTGKNAVWNKRETKAYRDWLEAKNIPK